MSFVIVALPDSSVDIDAAEGERLHITLKYVEDGEASSDLVVSMVKSAVEQIAAGMAPFEVKVSGHGRLGPNDAGVMFLESPELTHIHDLISGLPLAPDKYPSWIPHITLGYGEAFDIESAELADGFTIGSLAVWDEENAGDEYPLGAVNSVTMVDMTKDEATTAAAICSALDVPLEILVGPEEAKYINSLIAAGDGAFDPSLHPRGADGKFISKFGVIKWLTNGQWSYGTVQGIQKNENGKDVDITIQPSDLGGTPTPGKGELTLKPKQIYKAPVKIAHLQANHADAKKIGGQGGSNPGGLYSIPKPDKSGTEDFYVKAAQTAAHGKNEELANTLYGDAGVPVPDVDYNPSDKKIYSKIVSGDQNMSEKIKNKDEDWLRAVRKNFAVHAWLANNDVFGLTYDNILTDENNVPWYIDNGGALMFKATGGPKEDFGSKVTQLDIFRQGKKAAIFGPDMELADELDGAERVLAISPADIKNRVAEAGLAPDLADTLIARRAYIADYYGLTLPESIKHPDADPAIPTLAPVFDPVDIAKGKGKGKDWMPMSVGTGFLMLSAGDTVWLPDNTQQKVGFSPEGEYLGTIEAANQKLEWQVKFAGQEIAAKTSTQGKRPTHNAVLSGAELSAFGWQRGDQIEMQGSTYDVLWMNKANGGMLVQAVGPEGADKTPPFIIDTKFGPGLNKVTVKRWDAPAPIEHTMPEENLGEPTPAVEVVPTPKAPEGMAVEATAAIKADLEQPLPTGDGKPVDAKAAVETAALPDKHMVLGDNTVAKPGATVTSKFGGEYIYVKPKGPYAVVTNPNSDDPEKQLTKKANTLLQPGMEPTAEVAVAKTPLTSNGKVPQLGQQAEAKDGHTGEIVQISPDGKFVFILDANGKKKRKSVGTVKIIGEPEANIPEPTPETPEETKAPDLADLSNTDLLNAIEAMTPAEDPIPQGSSEAKTLKQLLDAGELKTGDKVSVNGDDWLTYTDTANYGSVGTYYNFSDNNGGSESYHHSSTATFIVEPAASTEVPPTPEPTPIPEAPHFSEDQFNALEPNDTLTLPSGPDVKIVGWAHHGKIAAQKHDGSVVLLHLSTFKPGVYGVVSGPDNTISPDLKNEINDAYNNALYHTPLTTQNEGIFQAAIAEGIDPDEAKWLHHDDKSGTFMDLSDANTKVWDPKGKVWVENTDTLPEEMPVDIWTGPAGVTLTAEQHSYTDPSTGDNVTFIKGDNGSWYTKDIGSGNLPWSQFELAADYGYNPPQDTNKVPEATTTGFNPDLQGTMLGQYELSGKVHDYVNKYGGATSFVQDINGEWHPEDNESPDLTYTAQELVDFYGMAKAEDQLPQTYSEYVPLPGDVIVATTSPEGKSLHWLKTKDGAGYHFIGSQGSVGDKVIEQESLDKLGSNPGWTLSTVYGDTTPDPVVEDAASPDISGTASPLSDPDFPVGTPTVPGQKIYKIENNIGNLWLSQTGPEEWSSYGNQGTNSALTWDKKEFDQFQSKGSVLATYQVPDALEPTGVPELSAPPALPGMFTPLPGQNVKYSPQTGSYFVEVSPGVWHTILQDGALLNYDASTEAIDADPGVINYQQPGANTPELPAPPALKGGYIPNPGSNILIFKMNNSYGDSEYQYSEVSPGIYKQILSSGGLGTFEYDQAEIDDMLSSEDYILLGKYKQPVGESAATTFDGYEAKPGDTVIKVDPIDGSAPNYWVNNAGQDVYYKVGSTGSITSASVIEGMAGDSAVPTMSFVYGKSTGAAPEAPTTTAGVTAPIALHWDNLTFEDGSSVSGSNYFKSVASADKASGSITGLGTLPEGSKLWVHKDGSVLLLSNTGQASGVNAGGSIGTTSNAHWSDSSLSDLGWLPVHPGVGTSPGVDNKPDTKPAKAEPTVLNYATMTVNGQTMATWLDESGQFTYSHDSMSDKLDAMPPLQPGEHLVVDKDGDVYVWKPTGNGEMGNLYGVSSSGKVQGYAWSAQAPLSQYTDPDGFLQVAVPVVGTKDPNQISDGFIVTAAQQAAEDLLQMAKAEGLPYDGAKMAKLKPGQFIDLPETGAWVMAGNVYVQVKPGKYEYGQKIDAADFDGVKTLPGINAPTSINMAAVFIVKDLVQDKPEVVWPGKKKATPEEIASWGGDLTKDGHIPVPGLNVQFGKFQGKVVSVSKDKTKVVTIKADGTKSTRLLSTLSVNPAANYKDFAPKPVPVDVPEGMPLAVDSMADALSKTAADGKFRALLPGQDGIRNGEMFVYGATTPSGKKVNRVSFALTKEYRKVLKDMLANGEPAAPELGDWAYTQKLSQNVAAGDRFTMRLSSTPNPDGSPRWKIDPNVKPPTHEVVSTQLDGTSITVVTLKDLQSGEVITSRFHHDKTVSAAAWDATKPKPLPPMPAGSQFKLSALAASKGWKVLNGSDGVHSAIKNGAVHGTLDIEPGNPVPIKNSAWADHNVQAAYSTDALRFVSPDGVVIEVSSLSAGTGSYNSENNSFKGNVVITLPEGGTQEQLNSALTEMGLGHKPLTQAKAKQNMLPLLRSVVSWDKTNIDTTGTWSEDKIFTEAGKVLHVSDLGWHDVLVGVDESTGKTSYYWSERVRDSIDKHVKVNLAYRGATAGDADKIVSTALFGTANAVSKRLTGMVYTPDGKGLGASAYGDANNNAGHGGYMYGYQNYGGFTNMPQFKTGGMLVVSRSTAVLGRIMDFHAAEHDAWGDPGNSHNNLKTAMNATTINDWELNGGLPVEATGLIAVSSDVERQAAIKKLEAMDIFEINGMPLDKFIILKSQLGDMKVEDLPPVFIPPNARPILDLPESYDAAPAAAVESAA